jgi:hypothetical protein
MNHPEGRLGGRILAATGSDSSMRFFVFLLGAVFIVAGATSIGFGIDIIQVERGWTEVISGAVVLAAGAVIVALGCVVAKLEKLLKTAEGGIRASQSFAASMADAPTALANFETQTAEPARLRTPPATVPEREWTLPAPVAEAEAAAVTAAAEPAAAEAAAGVTAAAFADGAGPGSGQAVSHDHWPGEEEPRTSPLHAEPSDEVDRKTAPPVVAASGRPREEIAESAAESDFEWLERALSDSDKAARPEARPDDWRRDEIRQENIGREESRHAGPRHAEGRPQVAGRREEAAGSDLPAAHDSQAMGERPEDRKEHVLRAVPPSEPPAHEPAEAFSEPRHNGRDEPLDHSGDSGSLAPTAADPAILGRYQANGNSYVMFSDGSIEAVTQTGVYRFGSMAELKAFIEAQA